MPITNMIPTLWSARIINALEKTLVYGQPQVPNTDYQGEISGYGSQVHVHRFADVTVSNYVKNSTTVSYEQLTDSRVTLTIDQSKYWAVKLDDIDQAQMHPKILDAVARRAAYQLADIADQHLASRYTEVAAGNTIATSQFTIANVYGKFVNQAQRMDEADLPATGRFVVIPPWIKSLLLQDNNFVTQSKPDVVLNGQIGTITGISVLVSNNVPTVGTAPVVTQMFAGTSGALSFAQQISQVDGLRLEGSFSDALRGLHLYGSKLVNPDLAFLLRANL